MHAFALKARYLFPVDGPPIPDGVLTMADERIVAVGENVSGSPLRDLGNVALLPGLINAHTHLEFSDLSAPLGQSGVAFADWIASIVTRRRAQSVAADWPQLRYRAVERGLGEVERTGTVAVGEIAPPGWPEATFQARPVDGTVFLELLGLSQERVEPLLAQAAEHAAGAAAQTKWRAGLSPHAPYTVHPELLARMCPLCRQFRVPLAMHLAETREELELLQSGSGPLVPMLQSFNAWLPTRSRFSRRGPLGCRWSTARARTRISGMSRIPCRPCWRRESTSPSAPTRGLPTRTSASGKNCATSASTLAAWPPPMSCGWGRSTGRSRWAWTPISAR
jgi:hypothetical protein